MMTKENERLIHEGAQNDVALTVGACHPLAQRMTFEDGKAPFGEISQLTAGEKISRRRRLTPVGEWVWFAENRPFITQAEHFTNHFRGANTVRGRHDPADGN